MRRLPVGLLKRKLAELEAQAVELTRMMHGRGELSSMMALRTIGDQDLDALEAYARRLEADPEAMALLPELLARERLREIELQYAACRTAEEAAAVYRGARSDEIQAWGIQDLARQLTAAAATTPGNGHRGRQGGRT